MKKQIFLLAFVLCNCVAVYSQNTVSGKVIESDDSLSRMRFLADEVVVSAIRASENTPTTYSTINKKDFEKGDLGQDITYLLGNETSIVSTSDAGTGIGYTSMRIRGVESAKTNVTINGVPYNDSESQGAYWVDIPNIASSAQSIQIQRGVGTSTNGAGAYGASINIQTDNISKTPFVEYSGTAGSFNTLKNSISFGNGLMKKHYFFEGRLSGITSDGYVDRGWSNLKSYFGQTGYLSDKTMVKFIAFGGWEETYQAWYGVDSASMRMYGRTYNPTGYVSTDSITGKQSFYDQMIDHYQQDNFQLHFAHQLNENIRFNAALHYTYGRGYYQDFVPAAWVSLNTYGLPNVISGTDTITSTDVVHRLWLDNHFYGAVWGLTYKYNDLSIIWGGGVNRYDNAKHYGEVLWARYFTEGLPGMHYYDNNGFKNDANTYLKVKYTVLEKLDVFGDMQIRYIHHKAWGENKEYNDQSVTIDKSFTFFNPKAGIQYAINQFSNIYTSIAIANREPSRSDFLDAKVGETPLSERLYDLECGYRFADEMLTAGVVGYNMWYENQLVMTGEFNGVGVPIRKNVGKSFRRGLELNVGLKAIEKIRVEANVTLSQNKTDFSRIENDTLRNYNNSNIAYSPNIISGGKITYLPVDGLEIALLAKHVGEQYIDNTQSKISLLNSYTVTDMLFSYSMKVKEIGEIGLNVKLNNIFDVDYISNGRMSYGVPQYFPQAGFNFMTGLVLKF